MKPLQLLVMAALVGAGLLIYDTVKGEPQGGVTEIEVAPRAPTPGMPEVSEEARREGHALNALLVRVEALEERLLAIEGGERDPGTEPTGPASAPREWRPGVAVDGQAPEFEPESLAWFRAMEEAVAVQRRREASERSVAIQLRRAGVDLDDRTRQEVIDATLDYQARNRGHYKTGAAEKWTPEQRKAVLDKSRAAFEKTLESVAPRDAQTLLETLGKYPGFRPTGPFARER